MTLPAHIRRQVILASEAAIIKGAADFNDAASVEVARCQIDGMFNAMVRLRGAREAAEYAFARSDRIAGGLPAPVDFWAADPVPVDAPIAAAEPAPPMAASEPELPVAAPPRSRRWPIYLWGLSHGAVLALWFAWMLSRP